MKGIYVEWIDSLGADGWQYPGYRPSKNLTCKTCGFLFDECKDTITVTHSIGSNGGPCGPITIPKIAITKRKSVKI